MGQIRDTALLNMKARDEIVGHVPHRERQNGCVLQNVFRHR
jgi:hypothetical protein